MIFVTQKKGDDGLDYEGEKIEAENFEEAEQKAAQLGIEVLGILDTEWCDGVEHRYNQNPV